MENRRKQRAHFYLEPSIVGKVRHKTNACATDSYSEECSRSLESNQGPYSPTILENVLCLILKNFQYLAAFECNTTSDWLNYTVQPISNCVTFKLANSWRKRQRMFL